jgi:predicted nucleic acid-binding protein
MVVLDTTMLMLFFRPSVAGRKFDFAGKEIDHVKERVEFLVKELDKSKTQIIIPTPALSEILVRVGAAESQKILEKIDKAYVFRIEPFDTKAAIEVAAMTRAALGEGDKKGGSSDVWHKVKFDRQIVAIARVHRATTIYSDDKNIRTIAKAVNIQTIGLAALLLPPRTAQGELKLVLSPSNDPGENADVPEPEGPDGP